MTDGMMGSEQVCVKRRAQLSMEVNDACKDKVRTSLSATATLVLACSIMMKIYDGPGKRYYSRSLPKMLP